MPTRPPTVASRFDARSSARRLAAGLALLLSALMGSARAQPVVVLERLDIKGELNFTANGAFLINQDVVPPAVGEPPSQDMAGGALRAEDVDPASVAAGNGRPDNTPKAPPFAPPSPVTYTISVPDAPVGTEFDITGNYLFDGGWDVYYPDTLRTEPVDLSSPNFVPDCDLDPTENYPCLINQHFDECAGVAWVRFFRDATCPPHPDPEIHPGDPNYPVSGDVFAFRVAGGALQARTMIRHHRETRFPIQADSPLHAGPQDYEIRVQVTQGNDPFVNQVNTWSSQVKTISCGVVTEIIVYLPCPVPDCPVPPCDGGCPSCPCEHPPCDVGDVSGHFQVIGHENEVIYNANSDIGTGKYEEFNVPRVWLDDGPDDNRRVARVVPPPPSPPYDYPKLGTFTLRNVPLSTRPALFPGYSNYRMRGFYILNDSPAGKPCGPLVGVPCDGHLNFSWTSIGDGTRASDTIWTQGEILWETCANAPLLSTPIPPVAPPDFEQDWVFVDDPFEKIWRCQDYPITGCVPPLSCPPVAPSPGLLTTELDPIYGTAGADPLDTFKPFVMNPGRIDGTLRLTDGPLGGPHLPDVLERLSTFATALDPAYWNQMHSFVNAWGLRDPSPVGCDSWTADGNIHMGSLHLDSFDPGNEGEHLLSYRIVPGQLLGVSGWYETNHFRLKFLEDGPGTPTADFWDGAMELNRRGVPLLPSGVEEELNFRFDTDCTDTHDYCLAKLTVFVDSPDSDLSDNPFERPWIEGETDPVVPGEVTAFFHEWWRGLVFQGQLIEISPGVFDPNHAEVHLALPPGTYKLFPSVVFANRDDRTFYNPITSCRLECGETCYICTDPLACDDSRLTVLTPQPVVLSPPRPCSATAEVQLCIKSCIGDVTVKACTDDPDLGVADPEIDPAKSCSGLFGPAFTTLATTLTGPVGPPPSCHPFIVPVPLRDGVLDDDMTTFKFIVMAGAEVDAACDVTIETTDNPPTLQCPLPVRECIFTDGQVRTVCLISVADDCDATVDVTWETFGATIASGTGTCATVDFNLGLTFVVFTATDAHGRQAFCTATVRLQSGPKSCIDPVLPQCRPSPAATLSVPLTSSCKSLDTHPDPFPDTVTYSWTTVSCPGGTITDPTAENTPIEFPALAVDCPLPVDCTVRLTITESVPGGGTCSHFADTTFRVNPAPVARPGGPYTKCLSPPVTSVTLDGTGSFACDGSGLAFLWTIVGACPGGSLTGATTPTPVFTSTSTVPVTCTVELTVTDANGCKASAQTTITLGTGPMVKVEPVVACPDPTGASSCVTVTGTATGPNPTCTFAWTTDCVGGVFADPTSSTTTFCFPPSSAPCTITLTVTDCLGCVGSASAPVTVTEPPTAVATGGHACLRPGSPGVIVLSSAGSHSNPPDPSCTLTCSWSLVGCPAGFTILTGAPFSPCSPGVLIPAGTPAGSCTVCLTVTDCRGCVSMAACATISWCTGPTAAWTHSFGVLNLAPDAVAPPTAACPPGPYGAWFRDLSVPGDCGPIVESTWEFDPDGLPPVRVNPVSPFFEPFAAPGCKQVSLTVVDAAGCEDEEEREICIPECVQASADRIHFQCGGSGNSCGRTDPLEVFVTYQGLNACCDDPVLDPGAVASLTILGCTGPSTTIFSASVGLVGPGTVRIVFSADCVINAMRAAGCPCNSGNQTTPAVIHLDASLTCNDPGGCPSPLVVDSPFQLPYLCSNPRCLNTGCAPIPGQC